MFGFVYLGGDLGKMFVWEMKSSKKIKDKTP
jgi:hypothetical protein